MQFMTPEEHAAWVRQQHELHHMSVQDSIHERKHFVESLSEEQLKAFSAILQGLVGVSSKHARVSTAYMVGIVDGELKARFARCFCGEDHEAEMHVPSEGEKLTTEANQDFAAECAKYGVKPVSRGRVQCLGCNLVSVNLADRMLRQPGVEGCHGCQKMSATGAKYPEDPDA